MNKIPTRKEIQAENRELRQELKNMCDKCLEMKKDLDLSQQEIKRLTTILARMLT